MTTYDNLDLIETSLTFTGEGNQSVGSRTFDLSSLTFLPNVPLIDQIEVERIFDTGVDSKFDAVKFTIADRREMFILAKNWYSINEQTKILTVVDLATIPTHADNGLYYPLSRTYETVLNEEINIPVFQNVSTSVPSDPNNPNSDPIIRQFDTVIIRRKTLSKESIVTFAPGTRLTTTQLNLQFNQLKFIVQELLAKFQNESILKYDENAIDGPFLGSTDLRMSSNYIKDLGQVLITQKGTFPANEGSITYPGGGFGVNINSLHHAIVNGTVYRTGLNSTVPTISGNFTAGNLKISNLGSATVDTDAVRFDQVRTADNLIYGTLSPDRLGTNAIPLTKLQTTNAGNYTLPSSALETVNATIGTFGQSSPTNSNNMLRVVTDNKGRITSISHRTLGNSDLPDTTVTASTYGDSSTPLVQLTVNSKGLITTASERVIAANDLPNVNATNLTSGTVPLIRLPTDNVTFSGTRTIPNSITIDTYGRVTAVAGGSILASNVSDFNASSVSLIQANAPYWDSTNSVFTALRSGAATKIRNIANPTDNTDAVTLGYLNSNALVVSNNQISASNYPIKNLAMSAAPASTDAATVGYVLGLSLYGATPTIPQTITKSFPSGTVDGALYRYEFTFTNGSSDNLEAPTAEMLIVVDSDNKTYTPVTTATALGCQLDVGATTKTLKVWLTASSMSGKTLSVRNFGVSRIVSSGPATASSLGLVSVPVSGGIAVNNGEITLATATTSQIGGIRLSTGLVSDGGQLVKVDLSDDTNLSNSTKAASSKAVKDLRDLSVLKAGSTMTGGLVLAANTTTAIPLQFTSAASDPTAPANGSMWLISDALKFRASSGTKTVAFTDSNITGTASAWTTGRTIEVTGDVTGTSPSITGATNVTGWSLTTNPATNVKSVTGTTNRITATKNNTTGDVTLTLPQDIHSGATPTFGSVTANGIKLGVDNTYTISTLSSGTLSLNPGGFIAAGSIDASSLSTSSITASGQINSTSANSIGMNFENNNAVVGWNNTTSSFGVAPSAVSGVAAIGDMYLRVPASTGKAFVIKGTGNPATTDQIVTQETLNSFVAATANIANDAVTFDKLLNSPTSTGVIGRTGTTAANYEHISTATSGHVLVRGASSLGFGTIGTTSINDSSITTAKIADENVTRAKLAAIPKITVVTYVSGSGTFTVPAGVTSLKVTVVGGGGGGGSANPGANGGAGSTGTAIYAVTPSTGYTYSVGAGGAGAASGSANSSGTAGGTTTFLSMSAGGGAAGSAATLGSNGTYSLGVAPSGTTILADFRPGLQGISTVKRPRASGASSGLAFVLGATYPPGSGGTGAAGNNGTGANAASGGVGGMLVIEYIDMA
jgi:hypothetical protein